MQNTHIVGVFGDRGGFNAAWPVLQRAITEGCEVTLYFVGTCKELHKKGQLNAPGATMYVTDAGGGSSSEFFFEDTTPADLLIVGASNAESSVRDTARAISDNWPYCPIVMIEDMYGSARPLLETPEGKLINRVYVVDEFAQNMIANLAKGKNRIIVSGGPHFDAIMNKKDQFEQKRDNLRKLLGARTGLYHYNFLVVGGLNDTAAILRLLEQGIVTSGLQDIAKVILREHPRATEEDKRATAEYLKNTQRTWFLDVEKDIAPTSDDLLPIVGFVLSGYSTTNHIGILHNMPGVVYVGTQGIVQDHLREKGTERPPQVEAGAAWYVQDNAQMAHAISQTLSGLEFTDRARILRKQKTLASLNDGKATDRVWADIQSMLD